MSIPRTSAVAAVVALAFAAAPARPALAPTPSGPLAAANRYTDNHFGISGRARDWKAACLPTFGSAGSAPWCSTAASAKAAWR